MMTLPTKPIATSTTQLGVGFRPELALAIDRREDLSFVEILAEDFRGPKDVPQALKVLAKRGVEVLVHSVSLSLGQAPAGASSQKRAVAPEERARLNLLRQQSKHLDEIARYFDAPFVSDHIAFVRAGNLETGHLLPVERSIAMLAILQDNISVVRETLSLPLVLENIACTFDQPGAEMDEATFVRCVLEQNDCGLLLDLSNLFANAHNLQFSAAHYLNTLPLERLQYVHLAGGTFKEGLYHDTHCHPLKEQSLQLLRALQGMVAVPRVMLERDDSFPPEDEFNCELTAIRQIVDAPATQLGTDHIDGPQFVAEAQPCTRSPSLEPLARPLSRLRAQPQSHFAVGARQMQLTAALLGLGEAPSGFDAKRVAAASLALSRKRLRAMKRAYPCLAEHFANRARILTDPERDLERALLSYFAANPSCHRQGPQADALAFLKQVKMIRKLTAQMNAEVKLEHALPE